MFGSSIVNRPSPALCSSSSNATAQGSLPKFNQAVDLLRQSGDYPASVNVNLQQLLDNAATYIEIQDAIIKRGS